ncbi:hypothetical protein EDB19DRAFT_1840219 [Suillus lakei]|nr:hypothetical protein EDB19DRAFT_1840219 [Suillus lakei]
MAKRLKFGVYNDRAENETERNKLIASFQKAGIVSMRETSAIPIIVDMKRLRSGLTLSSDFTEPEKIRELDLVDRDEISTLRKWNEIREEMGVILGKLDNIGKWGVIVYNKTLLLAKGDDPEEEGDPDEQATLCLHELKRTQEKNARLQKVLANDSFFYGGASTSDTGGNSR